MRTPARRVRTHAHTHAPPADDDTLDSEILQQLEGWGEAAVSEEQVHTSRMRPHTSRTRRDGRGEAAVTEEEVAGGGRGGEGHALGEGGGDEKSASGLFDAEVLADAEVLEDDDDDDDDEEEEEEEEEGWGQEETEEQLKMQGAAQVFVCVCVFVCACVCIYICVCMYVCMYVCIYTIYTYIIYIYNIECVFVCIYIYDMYTWRASIYIIYIII